MDNNRSSELTVEDVVNRVRRVDDRHGAGRPRASYEGKATSDSEVDVSPRPGGQPRASSRSTPEREDTAASGGCHKTPVKTESPPRHSIRTRPTAPHHDHYSTSAPFSQHPQWVQTRPKMPPYVVVPLYVPVIVPNAHPYSLPWAGSNIMSLAQPSEDHNNRPRLETPPGPTRGGHDHSPPNKMRIPPSPAHLYQANGRVASKAKQGKRKKYRSKTEALPAEQYALMDVEDMLQELEHRTIDTAVLRAQSSGKQDLIRLLQRADRNGNRGRGVWFGS
jgi:hypothetical protein